MAPPSAVRRTAALVAVEGIALLALGLLDAVASLVGHPADRALSLGVAGFALLGGVVLLLLGRAIARLRGWARSPVVVVQLLAAPVGIGLAQNGLWPAAAVVLLLALGTLVHLAAPGTRGAFREGEP